LGAAGPKKNVGALPGGIMIIAAVAFALETTFRRPPPPLRMRKRNHFQFALPFPAF